MTQAFPQISKLLKDGQRFLVIFFVVVIYRLENCFSSQKKRKYFFANGAEPHMCFQGGKCSTHHRKPNVGPTK